MNLAFMKPCNQTGLRIDNLKEPLHKSYGLPTKIQKNSVEFT
ncbi:hypothetical protein XBKB1_2380009 [Xenorhabdus bovienii str. kraussei Becker Underwood]|uniref:Uncharacterized protein n=1 Tax=Xenorhabdus bovienii str. kraussei Becker Underwood TaxID=1398204 RepID=A0A077PSU3_XENBV|nr:hypothetical protein XBKB1_2380009 [Xenorhabdus bovienii str. kraussei Becker Underwood]